MKTKLIISLIPKNKQRCGVALMLFVCLALSALTTGSAQVRNQRRVTALQMGGAAEGSRVTVVSDSALNDYEAFRRGDRFYVKIPQADFTSAVPRMRADGFEDGYVQKVGDSLVVSFKLQPGATARVDQRGNRLDVIFSAPNRRSAGNTANAGSLRTPAGRVENPQTSSDRGRDGAGPLPPGSETASRGRVVSDRAEAGNESGAQQNPWLLTNPGEANKNSRKGSPTPSPISSPSSILSSGTSSSYPPLSAATPAVSPASRPGVTSAGSGGFANWRHRGAAAFKWISANRLATLLGALILLSLILYLAMAFRSRQKTVVKAKRAKAPKVQPKHSPDGELNELSSPSVNKPQPEVKSTRSGAVQEQPNTRGKEPEVVPAAAAATAPSQWVLTKPTIVSPTAGPDEYTSEEEEREVFEL